MLDFSLLVAIKVLLLHLKEEIEKKLEQVRHAWMQIEWNGGSTAPFPQTCHYSLRYPAFFFSLYLFFYPLQLYNV